MRLFFVLLSMEQQLNFPEPSPELYQKIISRLKQEQKKAAIFQAMIFLFISAVAAGFIVFGSYLLLQTLNQSGFAQIVALLASDYQFIAIYWQNYFLALLETAPLLPIVYLLIACLIFLLALKKGLLSLQRLILKH